jgi:tellurite resistance protein
MPMGATNEMYGTNADGSKSEDYCEYCFKNGEFTEICTMDEMIEACVPHVATADSGMSEDEARKMMRKFFPTLKRWKIA